jgi:DNA repair protein RadC
LNLQITHTHGVHAAKTRPKTLSLKDWPLSERPRERLLEHGVEALSDAELLAVLFTSGIRGHSALDIAHSLLARFGSLRGLLAAKPDQWQATPGVGAARAARLDAALEIHRRQLKETLGEACTLTAPALTRQFLLAQLRDRTYEVFCCLFLDNRHRLLAFEEIFRGTIDAATIYPREVVVRLLHHNAAALIVAHNHPSGSAEPSDSDHCATRRLRQAVELVDVRLLDHPIVGDGQCFSFAEAGLL